MRNDDYMFRKPNFNSGRSDSREMEVSKNFATISAKEIEKFMAVPNTVLIDLREVEEYKKGHIPAALNIPYEELESGKLCLLNRNHIILYCERGNVSLQEARNLSQCGYDVATVYGGIHAYRGKLIVDEE